jgi:hypothetical protein
MLKYYIQIRKQVINPRNNGQVCLKCCDDPKGCSDTTDPSEQGTLHLSVIKYHELCANLEAGDCYKVVKGAYYCS